MVQVRAHQPVNTDGSINLEAWLDHVQTLVPGLDRQVLLEACEFAREVEDRAVSTADNSWADGTSSFQTGLEIAEILADLKLDQESLVAAVIYRGVREGKVKLEDVAQRFGPVVAKLIEGVLRMAAISTSLSPRQSLVLGTQAQIENLRKMLVAMVDDVRVALIKLAERTCAIRAVKNGDEEKRMRVAREVFDIYAPLAHRLGIGHIKWELEDLSFRYLEPDQYKQIAKLLHERRLDREQYIATVMQQLKDALAATGIKADLSGRAKHIYSIWRKMQRKGLDFSQIYDVRAVRVLVPEMRDCYTALGIVHTLWRHIPKEFDDYIANPKENGYRSLHTAVIGPEGKVLEVQIRTHAMHEEAELGVCAHWRYKGTDVKASSNHYEEKISWLRQVLEWHEELGDIGGLAEQLRVDIEPDRVYVFTPDGHAIDLPKGSTPLDFAYRVHTEVGHNCRGAKINGRIVPLNYSLQTGEQVEIITGKQSGPSRDWLNQNLGYVTTSRARARSSTGSSCRRATRTSPPARPCSSANSAAWLCRRWTSKSSPRRPTTRPAKTCSPPWAPATCAWPTWSTTRSNWSSPSAGTSSSNSSRASRARSAMASAATSRSRASATCSRRWPAAASRCRATRSSATSPSVAA